MAWALNTLMGRTARTVGENERALVITDGRVSALLGPGRHMVARKRTELVMLPVTRARLDTEYLEPMVRAGLTEGHLTEVTTPENALTIVSWNGKPAEIHRTGTRAFYWNDAGALTVEVIDLTAGLTVPATLARKLTASVLLARSLTALEVPAGHVGMLTVDGAYVEALTPGTHWYWTAAGKYAVKLIDTRAMAHEVIGQEILTKDRVSLRVNLTATYQVTDPVRAYTGSRDFVEALHRALALAFRKTLGARTLDELLENKGQVDTEAATMVRAEMAELGIKVGEIALKDVILPGEMREILNGVVAAQKEAEANVIRRREETNATRSLLNTAKVMAENPVMLRLKELEALEAISGRVGNLTVVNGTEGLMQDVVKLR